MATILPFTPVMPGRPCPACEGQGTLTAFVHGPDAVHTFPCSKCEGSGTFTALAEAEGEVRYWRSMWHSARTGKQHRDASEQLDFWTNKTAMYAAMRKAGV